MENKDISQVGLCIRCLDTKEIFPSRCSEKPEKLRHIPMGMYHCPDCGTMVLAGDPHPFMCKECIDECARPGSG